MDKLDQAIAALKTENKRLEQELKQVPEEQNKPVLHIFASVRWKQFPILLSGQNCTLKIITSAAL
ncbi:MAG: hypothetical protein WA637_17710 [Terriglobales bacterium]